LFESIKKKFAEASGKLTKKVSEEAKEENNIKLEERTEETGSNIESVENQPQLQIDRNTETKKDLLNAKKIKSESKSSSNDKKERNFSKIGNKLGFRKSEDLKSEIIETEQDKTVLETGEKKLEDDGKKSGIFSFIREKTISEKDIDDILWELELSLLESDVAIDVANIVVESVKKDLIGQKIKRSSDIEEYTYKALKNAVSKIIDIDGKSMTTMIEEKKRKGEPLVVMFVGINGTGKTTTIGKLANYYLKKGYTPVVAASDTFRAGAIEQITYHTDKLGVKIVKHEKGSDPAAVAFDAVEHAKSKGKELVLIDTAGRMQTNTNLMDEMKKIRRVAKPDLVIFVGDALTGNDAVEQATKFNDAIDVDGVILTKADADSKGGASLSIGYVIAKPIMFLGVGQDYGDLKEYNSDWMLEQIFS
jgi:fused signal recognition particle receptor